MLNLDVVSLHSLLQHGWFLSIPLFFMLLTCFRCESIYLGQDIPVWVSLVLPHHHVWVVPFEQEPCCHVSAVLKEG